MQGLSHPLTGCGAETQAGGSPATWDGRGGGRPGTWRRLGTSTTADGCWGSGLAGPSSRRTRRTSACSSPLVIQPAETHPHELSPRPGLHPNLLTPSPPCSYCPTHLTLDTRSPVPITHRHCVGHPSGRGAYMAPQGHGSPPEKGLQEPGTGPYVAGEEAAHV